MRKGFTLVELMVIVAIVLILASIIIPNMNKARREQQNPQNSQTQSAPMETPARPAYEIDLSSAGISADAATTPDSVGMVFCLDRSGSMSGKVDNKRKIDISKEAMRQVFAQVEAYTKAHPDKQVKVGLCAFNSAVETLHPLDVFDKAKLEQALQPMQPAGGTAVGLALELATAALLKSGVETKAILVMTDGENTSGVDPQLVVEAIKGDHNSAHALTAGIETYLVAFDVAAAQFAEVKKAGAVVLESRDQKSLEGIMGSLVEQVLLEKE